MNKTLEEIKGKLESFVDNDEYIGHIHRDTTKEEMWKLIDQAYQSGQESLMDYLRDFAFKCSQRGILLPQDLSETDKVIDAIRQSALEDVRNGVPEEKPITELDGAAREWRHTGFNEYRSQVLSLIDKKLEELKR